MQLKTLVVCLTCYSKPVFSHLKSNRETSESVFSPGFRFEMYLFHYSAYLNAAWVKFVSVNISVALQSGGCENTRVGKWRSGPGPPVGIFSGSIFKGRSVQFLQLSPSLSSAPWALSQARSGVTVINLPTAETERVTQTLSPAFHAVPPPFPGAPPPTTTTTRVGDLRMADQSRILILHFYQIFMIFFLESTRWIVRVVTGDCQSSIFF